MSEESKHFHTNACRSDSISWALCYLDVSADCEGGFHTVVLLAVAVLVPVDHVEQHIRVLATGRCMRHS